jgi:hypothetical protein
VKRPGRIVFVVMWDRAAKHWGVNRQGAIHYEATFVRKPEAIKAGRRLAKNAGEFYDGAWGGQLVIKGKNGRIQTEHTYGHDPRRFKG